MPDLYYEIAPWEWRSDVMGGSWCPPSRAVAAIDLGTDPTQVMGGFDRGYGFFASTESSPYSLLSTSGDCRELQPGAAAADQWETLLGYRPQGDTLAEWIFDHLLMGDPEGNERCRPLVPGTDGLLRVNLHGTIKSERFVWGQHRHTNRLRDLLRLQLAGTARDRRGPQDAQHENVLGGLAAKYLGGWNDDRWRELLPQSPEMRDRFRGPRQPATSYTDDFSGTLGSWTQLSGTWGITSGALGKSASGSTFQFIRRDSDVSGTDHWCDAYTTNTSTSLVHTPAARISSSGALTAYCSGIWTTLLYCTKMNPTQTNISTISQSFTGADTFRVYPNGSTINIYFNGSLKLSPTDTSISGQIRGGCAQYNTANGTLDDWLIDDGITPGGIPVMMHQLKMQGIS